MKKAQVGVKLGWWLTVMLFCLPLYAAEKLQTINAVDAETNDKGTMVNVRLDTKVAFAAPTLEDHGTFLQLQLPHTATAQSGQFVDVTSPYVEKIAQFQANPSTTAIRFFVSDQASVVKQAVTVDILDNRLLVFFDHKKLADLKVKVKAAVSATPSADEVIATTEVRRDIPDPAQEILGDKANKADNTLAGIAFGKESPQLKPMLIKMTLFCAVMIAGLVFMQVMRRMRRVSRGGAYEPSVSMKAISTYALAPKHKLTLLQVGNQQILVGVSPDGVNYLTTINQGPQAPVMAMPASYMQAMPTPPAPRSLPEAPVAASERMVKQSADGVTRKERPAKKSSFTVAVDDEGPRTLEGSVSEGKRDVMAQKSIEDVTSLIRRKLRNLPDVT